MIYRPYTEMIDLYSSYYGFRFLGMPRVYQNLSAESGVLSDEPNTKMAACRNTFWRMLFNLFIKADLGAISDRIVIGLFR